ncbi:LysR family transcriptional regulator [Endozoicomonas sp. ONNA1]|uniref:LysR family transcriptional regulator n=1 Tax=Endozoicomonas sp. ONNA1 TaxID=2828740 RepID=UPI002147FEB8|nr:LysR family transcriptional regulator [Endozoicomonas sp. ONNA1]
MFSYEHLAAFCATFEEASYSKAAKKLNKDRTTVREQVKALEDSFAIRLFTIEGKKAVATTEADALYRQAKVLVKNSDLLYRRMIDRYKQALESLIVYHDNLVPNSLIKTVNQSITEQFPMLRLHWLHRNRDETLDALVSNQHCVAIMQSRLKNMPERTFSFINLGTSEQGFYCHPDHPLAKRDCIQMNELELAMQYLSENHHNSNPELYSISSNVRLVSNNDVLLTLLLEDGWAILEHSLAAPLLQSGKLVNLNVNELVNAVRVPLSFYCPPELENYPEVVAVKSVLLGFAKDNFR